MKADWIPVTRYEQNCSILWCEETKRCAVVDPGGDIDNVLDFLEWEGLTLEVALVTHGHMDHAGAAKEISERTGARIEGPHRGDEHLLARLPEMGDRYGVPSRAFAPDRWLDDGDVIRFGNVTIEALHCPGHSRGHMAYFHRGSRMAFVGDILFRGTIGAWEHADGDLVQLVTSIRAKLFALGNDVRFIPGHGETSTFGRERRDNPFVGDEAMKRWNFSAPAG